MVIRTRKQIEKENQWRYRTGHAYAENLEKMPRSKQARKHWEHKPYGIGEKGVADDDV